MTRMVLDESGNFSHDVDYTVTPFSTHSPAGDVDSNATTVVDFTHVEVEHETDAITVLLMNMTLIGCLLLAYYVKQYRIYYLPERLVIFLMVYFK